MPTTPLPPQYSLLASIAADGGALPDAARDFLAKDIPKRKNAVVTHFIVTNAFLRALGRRFTDPANLTWMIVLLGWTLLLLYVSLWLFLIMGTLSILTLLTRRIVWLYRTQPLCQHCKYNLHGIPELSLPPRGPSAGPLRCPECGELFPLLAR